MSLELAKTPYSNKIILVKYLNILNSFYSFYFGGQIKFLPKKAFVNESRKNIDIRTTHHKWTMNTLKIEIKEGRKFHMIR